MMKKMETAAHARNHISYSYLGAASRVQLSWQFHPTGDKALLVAGDSREVVSS